MKMSKILMVGAMLTMSSTASYAATDGLLAATSSGTSDVTLIVSELVQITGLVDLVLDNGGGTANTFQVGAGDVSFTSTFCSHYNNATGVDLTLTSGNTPAYRMDDGGGNFVTYQIEIDEDNDGGPIAHAEAVAVTYATMGTTTLGCGGDLDSVRAFVDDAAPLGVPNGNYSDTLTFLLAPNP